MKDPILTTVGTNKMMKVLAIVGAILSILAMIFVYSTIMKQIDPYPAWMQEIYLEKVRGLIVFTVVVFAMAFIYDVFQWAACRSYVNVYEDRMEGKGVQNIYQIVDFSLSYDKITNVTCMGMNLYIHTPGGKYKIVTDTKTAKAIFKHYSQVSAK